MSRLFVLGCFLLSGATGLVYEVVWMRQLELTIGATTAAVSALLAVFVVGLGAGAGVFGPIADRHLAPLRLYGLLEAGVGLYALAFPGLLEGAGPFYAPLARLAAGYASLLLALRLLFASLLLLVPTMLMGGTLPVLVRLVDRAPDRFGRGLGLLYAVNLAGAVLGVVACAFVLIPALGIRGATVAAATANLSIAAAALVAGNRARARPSEREEMPTAIRVEPLSGTAPRLVLAVVVLSGFTTMGYEVLFTRILTFTFTSTVHTFAVVLASFLGGLTLGSAIFAALERRVPGLLLLGWTQALAGIVALGLAPGAVIAPGLVTALSEAWGYTGNVFVAATALSSALVVLLPATLMGLAFPLGSRLLATGHEGTGRVVGAAYLGNSLGCVAGSLITGFALIPLLGLAGSVLLLSAAQLVAGGALVLFAGSPGPRSLLALAAASAAALAFSASLRGPQPFDTILQEGAASVVTSTDGVAATTSVVRYPDGRTALHIDGFEAAGEGGHYGYMRLMAHVPALLHPQPRRVLVICFGTGTTAGAALVHAEAVDAVDLNRAVFDFAPHFRENNGDVFRSPRARLIVDDGRNYLATTRERYDVITSEPMPPTFAGAVNLYSREYYALARERLLPGGFVVQWLPFHLLRLEQTLSILRTVQEVFPETTLWVHADTGFVLARHAASLSIDLPALRARLGEARFREPLEPLDLGSAEALLELYTLGPAGVRAMTAGAAAVTDDRPSLEFHEPRHRTVVRVGGGYQREEARALEIAYRLRGEEPLPLANAATQERDALALARAFGTRLLLGDLYLSMWLFAPARHEFEEGLRLARTPEQGARILAALAELSRREGADGPLLHQ